MKILKLQTFETSIFIQIFLVMCCMTTLYISGLFLSHLGNNVHLEAMQEQVGEEQKKASSSYLFSYTITTRLIVSASGKLEAQLPPVEGQTQHKDHMHFGVFFCAGKAYKPSNTDLHKEQPT